MCRQFARRRIAPMARPEAREMEAERPYKTSLALVGVLPASHIATGRGFSSRVDACAGLVSLLRNQVQCRRDQPDVLPTAHGEDALAVAGVGAARILLSVLKASQLITHQRRLANCGEDSSGWSPATLHSVRQLACILFQLPPSLGRDNKRLEQFIHLAAENLEWRLFRLASRLNSGVRPGIQARHWICWPGTAPPWCFTT